MNLGEYIHKLQVIEEEYGKNVEVTDSNLEPVGDPEWMPDEHDGAGETIVVCEQA